MDGIHPHLPLLRRTRRHPRTMTRRPHPHLHLHHVLIQPPKRSSRARRGPTAVRNVLGALGAEHGAEDAVDDGLQDGQAGAGDADVHFDGGPDEGAGVGVGAVGEGDGGDGVGADDADGADAGGEGLVVMMASGGIGGVGDVQCAHGEDGAQGHLPPPADLQLPHDAHREHEDREVHHHVRHRGADQVGREVDVVRARGQVFEVGGPEQPRRRGLEDGGEEDGDAPGRDEREQRVDGRAEGGADAEEAEVEGQDGAFDRGDEGPVEDLDAVDDLREGGLLGRGDGGLVGACAVGGGDEVEGGGAEGEEQGEGDEGVVPPEGGGGEPAGDEAQEDGEGGGGEGEDVDGDDLVGFAVVELGGGRGACHVCSGSGGRGCLLRGRGGDGEVADCDREGGRSVVW